MVPSFMIASLSLYIDGNDMRNLAGSIHFHYTGCLYSPFYKYGFHYFFFQCFNIIIIRGFKHKLNYIE